MRRRPCVLLCFFAAVASAAFAGDIHEAARDSVTKLAKLLAEDPALLNAKDELGRTPLYLAVAAENSNTVAFLIRKHADLRAADNNGGTPLHFAALACSAGMTRMLLISDKKLADIQDKHGKIPLHNAASRCYCMKVCELLLLAGTNVFNRVDNKNRTPLHYAVEGGCQSIVEYLLSKGANINARDIEGNSPLNIAVKGRSESLQRYLRKRGAQE
jgi:ankyrin repeat protein